MMNCVPLVRCRKRLAEMASAWRWISTGSVELSGLSPHNQRGQPKNQFGEHHQPKAEGDGGQGFPFRAQGILSRTWVYSGGRQPWFDPPYPIPVRHGRGQHLSGRLCPRHEGGGGIPFSRSEPPAPPPRTGGCPPASSYESGGLLYAHKVLLVGDGAAGLVP